MIMETGGEVKDIVEASLKTKGVQAPGVGIDVHSDVSDLWKSRIFRELTDVNTLSDDQKSSENLYNVMERYHEEIAGNLLITSLSPLRMGIRMIQFSPNDDYSNNEIRRRRENEAVHNEPEIEIESLKSRTKVVEYYYDRIKACRYYKGSNLIRHNYVIT